MPDQQPVSRAEIEAIRRDHNMIQHILDHGGDFDLPLLRHHRDRDALLRALDAAEAENARLRVQAEIAFLEGWASCTQARQQPSLPQDARKAWEASRSRTFVAALSAASAEGEPHA